MAELDCFITRDEFASLLETALGSGFRLCLNQNLARPEHEYLHAKNSIRERLEAEQFAFILERDDFSRYPIRLRRIVRDGGTAWYPRPKEGGPAIEAYFFAPHVKDETRFVACSLLAYGTKIINPTTGREEVAGGAIKEAFEALAAPIRKNFKRVRSSRRIAYVSPGVEALIESGWQLAPPFNMTNDLRLS